MDPMKRQSQRQHSKYSTPAEDDSEIQVKIELTNDSPEEAPMDLILDFEVEKEEPLNDLKIKLEIESLEVGPLSSESVSQEIVDGGINNSNSGIASELSSSVQNNVKESVLRVHGIAPCKVVLERLDAKTVSKMAPSGSEGVPVTGQLNKLCKMCGKPVKLGTKCGKCNVFLHNKCFVGGIKEREVWICHCCALEGLDRKFCDKVKTKDNIIQLLTIEQGQLVQESNMLIERLNQLEMRLKVRRENNVLTALSCPTGRCANRRGNKRRVRNSSIGSRNKNKNKNKNEL